MNKHQNVLTQESVKKEENKINEHVNDYTQDNLDTNKEKTKDTTTTTAKEEKTEKKADKVKEAEKKEEKVEKVEKEEKKDDEVKVEAEKKEEKKEEKVENVQGGNNANENVDNGNIEEQNERIKNAIEEQCKEDVRNAIQHSRKESDYYSYTTAKHDLTRFKINDNTKKTFEDTLNLIIRQDMADGRTGKEIGTSKRSRSHTYKAKQCTITLSKDTYEAIKGDLAEKYKCLKANENEENVTITKANLKNGILANSA